MSNSETPTFKPYLLPTLLMLFIGWGGLASLLNFALPTVIPRWGFFALWFIALTGTALPIFYLTHLRLNTQPFIEPRAIIRQSQWLGIYGAVLAWLQLGRLLTLWIVLGLAAGLLAIEALIRMRERSLWTPPFTEDD